MHQGVGNPQGVAEQDNLAGVGILAEVGILEVVLVVDIPVVVVDSRRWDPFLVEDIRVAQGRRNHQLACQGVVRSHQGGKVHLAAQTSVHRADLDRELSYHAQQENVTLTLSPILTWI